MLWGRMAVYRRSGTCKSEHQSAHDDGNPAARISVDRNVTPAATASLRNAFAAEQRSFSFTGGAHWKSPLGFVSLPPLSRSAQI